MLAHEASWYKTERTRIYGFRKVRGARSIYFRMRARIGPIRMIEHINDQTGQRFSAVRAARSISPGSISIAATSTLNAFDGLARDCS